jgi:hypothetical protein
MLILLDLLVRHTLVLNGSCEVAGNPYLTKGISLSMVAARQLAARIVIPAIAAC